MRKTKFKRAVFLIKGLLPRSLKRRGRRTWQNVIESIAYRRPRKESFSCDVFHIIFVCKGNICRSAFAEYYLRSITSDRSLKIESCGLDVDQGSFSPPDPVRVGYEFGVDLSRHHSKGVSACDFQNADLIVPMEYSQYLRLISLFPKNKKKIRLLRDFSPNVEQIFCNIYDPFGLDLREFRRCFSSIQRALVKFKEHHSVIKK